MSGTFEVVVLLLLVYVAYKVEKIHEHVRAIDERTEPDEDDSE